jgi:hypothetical protein
MPLVICLKNSIPIFETYFKYLTTSKFTTTSPLIGTTFRNGFSYMGWTLPLKYTGYTEMVALPLTFLPYVYLNKIKKIKKILYTGIRCWQNETIERRSQH